MITISENASKELNEFFKDKEKTPIRIYLTPGGCSGPRLGMALDESNTEDIIVEELGFTFCINKELQTQVGDVAIDMSYMGFTLEPSIPFENSGSGCSSCGSACASKA